MEALSHTMSLNVERIPVARQDLRNLHEMLADTTYMGKMTILQEFDLDWYKDQYETERDAYLVVMYHAQPLSTQRHLQVHARLEHHTFSWGGAMLSYEGKVCVLDRQLCLRGVRRKERRVRRKGNTYPYSGVPCGGGSAVG